MQYKLLLIAGEADEALEGFMRLWEFCLLKCSYLIGNCLDLSLPYVEPKVLDQCASQVALLLVGGRPSWA